MSDQRVTISVVLPVFNEQDVLPGLLNELVEHLSEVSGGYEIICVDDHSTDDTWSIINAQHQTNPHIKGVRFRRNFGHQLAIFAGIRQTRGEFVGVMDADGQDPPAVLMEMFHKCQDDYDVVYAVRTNRKESFFKRCAYALFYRFYKLIIPFPVPLDSGDFSVFRRAVADFIAELEEHRPFIRGLRSWYGGQQIGIEYDRPERRSGDTKYSVVKLMLLGLNGAVSFSKVPLRLISVLGIIVSFLSFIYGLYLLALKLTAGINLLGWTSTTVLIVFFGGLNLFVVGIIGEYIGDIFEEVKRRPAFLVDQSVGINE